MGVGKGQPRTTHGLCRTREYTIWAGMKYRCSNPNSRIFNRYGGRGIRVCERWQKFEAFLEDMGFSPSAKHSIERSDVNGDYTPDNCRWATPAEQSRNTTRSTYLEFNGKRQTVADWAIELGVTQTCLRVRLRNGWTIEQTLMTRSRKRPLWKESL